MAIKVVEHHQEAVMGARSSLEVMLSRPQPRLQQISSPDSVSEREVPRLVLHRIYHNAATTTTIITTTSIALLGFTCHQPIQHFFLPPLPQQSAPTPSVGLSDKYTTLMNRLVGFLLSRNGNPVRSKEILDRFANVPDSDAVIFRALLQKVGGDMIIMGGVLGKFCWWLWTPTAVEKSCHSYCCSCFSYRLLVWKMGIGP